MIGILFVVLAVMFLVVLVAGTLLLLDRNTVIESLRADLAQRDGWVADLRSKNAKATQELSHLRKSDVTARLHERMGVGAWPTRRA